MNYQEIETKYNAENVSLAAFDKFCKDKGDHKYIQASGYDHFYENATNEDSFCRLRSGPDMHQLTFKRKTKDANNYIRTEHNIDLARSTDQNAIAALLKEFGYHYNTSIFKSCFVYKYDWYTLVYYICYDTDMKELGRFVEIEMSEEHNWASKEEAWSSLTVIEKFCKPLGITPQARIKKSLFELYKKNL